MLLLLAGQPATGAKVAPQIGAAAANRQEASTTNANHAIALTANGRVDTMLPFFGLVVAPKEGASGAGGAACDLAPSLATSQAGGERQCWRQLPI